MFATVAAAVLALAASASAIPRPIRMGCDLSAARPTLPTNATGFAIPSTKLSYVALGVGVQNYTCGAAGNYTSTGAVAELFDMSCVRDLEVSDPAQIAYRFWNNAKQDVTIQEVINFLAADPFKTDVLGQHYFVPTPNTTTGAISPKWDFTSAGPLSGHADAYVIAAKDASAPGANATTDVPWLSLHGVQGDLASTILRLNTHGGQAPASCTPGDTTSVRYTAMYWLYGSTVST